MPDDRDAADLTVGQAAALLDLTVRTLHHWDEIDLASPSSRSAAGYRLYAASDLDRLRRIVVYRELGLELDEIRRVIDDPGTPTVAALRDQRTQVVERIRHLESLRDGLDRMVDAHEHGLLLSAEEQTATFGPGWNPRWPVEARQRYGDTAEWQQYAERSASLTAADWKDVADAASAFDRSIAEALDAGIEPGSPAADALVDRHRAVFSAYFPIHTRDAGRPRPHVRGRSRLRRALRRGAHRTRRLAAARHRRQRACPRHRPRHGDLAVVRRRVGGSPSFRRRRRPRPPAALWRRPRGGACGRRGT